MADDFEPDWDADLSVRCAPPPEGPGPVNCISITFGVPTHLTRDQERRLQDLVDEIIRSPWNQPQHGTHWLAHTGHGIDWQNRTPEGEPKTDRDRLHFGGSARPFVSKREKKRKQRQRADRAPDPDGEGGG